MENIAEINAEMARISRPIDVADDAFANLFKKQRQGEASDKSKNIKVSASGDDPNEMSAKKTNLFISVLQVPLAGAVAIVAFSAGIHFSGVAHSGVAFERPFAGRKIQNAAKTQSPRVMREGKQTIIRQTVSPVMATRRIDEIQNVLPQSVMVPLANIVASAYGRTSGGFDEDTAFKHPVESPVRKCGAPYQVGYGQTLEMISQEIYGTVKKWRQLYYVNRHMIGGSPTDLVVGQILKVPCGDVGISRPLKTHLKKKRKQRLRKQRYKIRTFVRIKKSHGNRLITITRVRRH